MGERIDCVPLCCMHNDKSKWPLHTRSMRYKVPEPQDS